MWIISRNSKKEFLLEANYKEQGLLMDSKINVGNNIPEHSSTELYDLNTKKYDVINYPKSNEKSGICHSIGNAIKAVYHAPMCVKVMGALGLLTLVGSSISAYNAITSAKLCRPSALIPPIPPQENDNGFNNVISNLPIVILTSEPTSLLISDSSGGIKPKCNIGNAIATAKREGCSRWSKTAHEPRNETNFGDVEILAGVSPSNYKCTLNGMMISGVDGKDKPLFGHGYKKCDVYDGVNKKFNCLNIPKTASEARRALYDLGQNLAKSLKESPNYKKDCMTESAKAYAEIAKMANSYNEASGSFNLGSELLGGFSQGLRNESRYEIYKEIYDENNVPKESPTLGKCIPNDPAWHATNINMACGFGALGMVMLFGAILTADFGKSNTIVRVGMPKNNGDMMVMVYNNVVHHYDTNEITFGNNFTFDLTNLAKYLMDKGEDLGEVFELTLEICDKVDQKCGNTTNGDKAMNSVRAYMRENHTVEFTKYLIAMGIEEPDKKDGSCWVTSMFNWSSGSTSKTHSPVPQAEIAEPEEIDEPIYAGIPMNFIRSSGSNTPPLSASTPYSEVRAEIVGTENRYSMGNMSALDMELGDLDKGFSQSLGSLTDGTYREHS